MKQEERKWKGLFRKKKEKIPEVSEIQKTENVKGGNSYGTKQNKKSKEEKTEKSGSSAKDARGFQLFTIQNKIIICFIVPIIFMIMVGSIAYQKASEGMSEKFRVSTEQAVEMATSNVDVIATFVEAEALSLSTNEEMNKYNSAVYKNDVAQEINTVTYIKNLLMSAQKGNKYVDNIHIVTEDDVNMLSTYKGGGKPGIFEEYVSTMKAQSANGKSLERWVDDHTLLDEYLELPERTYILSFQMMSKYQNAVIVIDFKKDEIEEFLNSLDMGEGSIVGLVTANGKEIVCENLSEGQESTLDAEASVFYQQPFYAEYVTEDTPSGSAIVDYNGAKYLFIYSVNSRTGATVCALVPNSVVTDQAGDIGKITVVLVLIAIAISGTIGILISTGIQKNVKKISGELKKVAKGDLTGKVTVKGNDEFKVLAESTTSMLKNNKKLIQKVNVATGQLEDSTNKVTEASAVINEYSLDINQAIEEITDGMVRQSRHAEECLDKTDALSNEIQAVSLVIDKVEQLVNRTNTMIGQGMEIVNALGKRAQDTNEMANRLGESIQSLQEENVSINKFVGIITDISQQTNLLSLNASIEAARVGAAGKGFAVVAEEIRKLADDSSNAANEVRQKVGNISIQTDNSVEVAKETADMIALQSEAVEEVIAVFVDMSEQTENLVKGLDEIVSSMENADAQRHGALDAVKNISEIISEAVSNAETVSENVQNLLAKVEMLNDTAKLLGENMVGLKEEIAVFKVE